MNSDELKKELLKEFGGSNPNDLLKVIGDINDDSEPQFLSPSNYQDLDTIEPFIAENRQNFTVFSVNIECINTKFSELQILLKYLKEKYQFNFSVICLQECWLSDDEEVGDLDIPGYQVLPQKYQCSRKGGLVTYVYHEFSAKDTKLFKPSPKRLWEAQSVNIKGSRLHQNINLVNLYRPPRHNSNNERLT